jgi:hypothetical protein
MFLKGNYTKQDSYPNIGLPPLSDYCGVASFCFYLFIQMDSQGISPQQDSDLHKNNLSMVLFHQELLI